MSFNRGLFSSAKPDWATPEARFEQLDREFHFTLDGCATAANAKCPRFFAPEQDGLLQDWGGEVCYCNPPYGAETIRWVQKARKAVDKPKTTVVCLLPSRTDTRWWHEPGRSNPSPERAPRSSICTPPGGSRSRRSSTRLHDRLGR